MSKALFAIAPWMGPNRLSSVTERKGTVRRVVAVLVMACVLLIAASALATTYTYDSSGRLAVVTDNTGASSRYVYDGIGNLVRVDALAANSLAIYSFTPGRGPAGASITVKVQGHGFSTTPSQDVLKFNGVTATVTAATAIELTTTVPVGATTGPLSLTVGALNATSATNFVVDPPAPPPLISSLSPLIATVGTAVTVAGNYFNPVLNQTSIKLANLFVLPSSLAATSIVFQVPTGVASGHVTVTTPNGQAISTQTLIVVPPGVALTDIAQFATLTINAAPQAMSVSTAGKSAAVAFDGTAGSLFSAQFSAISVSSIAYTLYDSNNQLITNGSVSATSPTIHFPVLAKTGTYLLLLTPNTWPASWTLAIENRALLVGGSVLAIPTTAPWQSKRLNFVATQGANMGLALTNVVSPGSSYVQVTVSAPDGSQVAIMYCRPSVGGCDLDLKSLVAGIYIVMVAAPTNDGNGTMSFQATLSADVAATLTLNTPYALNLPRNGENGRLTFAGTVGQALTVQITSTVTVPAGTNVNYVIYAPDGSVMFRGNDPVGMTIKLSNLPATGNYLIFVEPAYATLTVTVTLVSAMPGALVVDGASNAYSTTIADQSVHLTITAGQGANLGLGLSNLVTSGSVNGLPVFVYAPNGSQIVYGTCYASLGGCDLNLTNLAAGIYNVVVEAPLDGAKTMSFQATLSSDVAATLSTGSAYNLNLSRNGQNGRLTFAGTVGQTVGVQVNNPVTVPAGTSVTYTIFAPNGSILTGTTATVGSTFNLPNLPTTGIYTVFVDPYTGVPLTAQVTLVAGVTGTLAVDGATSAFTTTTSGQNIYLSFTAVQGANLGLGMSGVVMPGSASYIFVSLLAPDGSQIYFQYCYASHNGCDLSFKNLAAGTYSIVFKPPTDGAGTMRFQTTLSTDLTATLSPNITYSLNLSRNGQHGRLSFAGTAGQTVAVQVTNPVTVPSSYVSYTIYSPSGASVGGGYTATGATFNVSNLPMTGAYLVWIEPIDGATLTEQVKKTP